MRRPEQFPTWSWDPLAGRLALCRKNWENRPSLDLIPGWNQSNHRSRHGSRALEHCSNGLASRPQRTAFIQHHINPTGSSHSQPPLSTLQPPPPTTPGGVLKPAPCGGEEEPTLAAANPHSHLREPGTSTGMPPVLFHQHVFMHAFNLQLASPSVQPSYPLCKNYSVNWERGSPLVNGGTVVSYQPSLRTTVC